MLDRGKGTHVSARHDRKPGKTTTGEREDLEDNHTLTVTAMAVGVKLSVNKRGRIPKSWLIKTSR